MKTKNILIVLLLCFTFMSYAQSEISETSDAVLTEFKMETENLDDFTNFDWNIINEIFENNDANQEITLAFTYMKKTEVVEFKLVGKTANLDDLITSLKSSFEKLDE